MKVLLINPPMEIHRGEYISVIAPLGLAYIAAVLEKEGHEVKILDCLAISHRKPIKLKRGKKIITYYSPSDRFFQEYLRQFEPEIVGISNLVSPTEEETLKLARKIKKILPQAKIVVGGSNASARTEFLIKNPDIDFVVVGEGEETMRELVHNTHKKSLKNIRGLVYRDVDGGIITNPSRPFIADLDRLPFPAWHLLPMEEYLKHQPAGIFIKKGRVVTVITSRGCPNGCNFCTNEKIWGRYWRARSVKNVIAEIKLLKKIYKVEEIQFVDSNISVHKDRFINLCRALKKERTTWLPAGGVAVLTLNQSLVKLMAESGCYALMFGIEHGDLGIQKRIGKIVPLKATKELVDACHKYGIWAHGNFIVGLPGETMKTAYKSLDYALKADLDSVSFFTALPLPGSKIYQELKTATTVDLASLRFYLSEAKCSELSAVKMKEVIKSSFRRFMFYKLKREFNPETIVKRLRQIHSFDDIKFYFIMLKRFIQIESIN